MGAELLTVSAEWPLVRCEQWMALLKARAIENQMYVAACNCCDVSGKELFAGHSMIIAPDGTVLAQAGTEEDLLFADVNRDEVGRIRNSLHIFAERRPEVYGAF
jgi:predicted amidohydrolase